MKVVRQRKIKGSINLDSVNDDNYVKLLLSVKKSLSWRYQSLRVINITNQRFWKR